jgi:PPM family protein phosphatase
MKALICPNCHAKNRPGAKFCGNCRTPFQGSIQEPSQPDPSISTDDVRQVIGNIARKVDKKIIEPVMKAMDELFEEQEQGDSNAPTRRLPSSEQSPRTGAVVISQAIPLKKPGEWIRGYVIQKSKALKRSNYYTVCMAQCKNGHINPQAQNDKCGTCQLNLQINLIHETVSGAQGGNGEYRKRLVNWPITPGLLKHIAIFDDKGNQYVVTDQPLEPWQSLSEITTPIVDTKWIVENCARIGDVVLQLSMKSYVLSKMSSRAQGILEAIVWGNDQKLALADLSIFIHSSQAAPIILPKSPTNQEKYIFMLGQILFTLASGHAWDLCREETSAVPFLFRGLIDRAHHGENEELESYLSDLKQIQQNSQAMRGLRQIAGYATDNGRQRDHNEDYVEKFSLGVQQSQESSETGLYAVADGMGGQQAGEKASKLVVEVIHKSIQLKFASLQAGPRLNRETLKLSDTMTPEKILHEAVLEANSVLLASRQKSGSDRGTTITSALIVGNNCAIANVGDSRTYLLHNGKLEQVSRDHSLVARLLEAGVIKAEEVRSHPQRNQIYRTLGDKPKLEVDTFTRVLTAGDRLLLCSDGLWEMVLDQEMERTLKTASSPQAACDQLISKANIAGGDDNISVIVVWIE